MNARWMGTLMLVTACGAKAPAVGLAHEGVGAAPAGPAPTITWVAGTPDTGYGEFTSTGLPAVAADGGAVMLAVTDDDAARGFPNLALVERGRDDRELGKRVVLALPVDDEEPSPPKDVQGANQWLAERHQQRDWRPLTAAAPPAPPDDGAEEDADDVITLGAVEVRWNEGHLVVTSGGAKVVDATHADWTVKPYPMCDSCDETCVNPSTLRAVAGDLANRLLVVTIAYRGNDSCWEPSAAQHVVSW